jgi:hypothetical protein
VFDSSNRAASTGGELFSPPLVLPNSCSGSSWFPLHISDTVRAATDSAGARCSLSRSEPMAQVLERICDDLCADGVLCSSEAAERARREVIEHVLMNGLYEATVSAIRSVGVKRHHTPEPKLAAPMQRSVTGTPCMPSQKKRRVAACTDGDHRMDSRAEGS